MNSGLLPTKPDRRDYDLHRTFGTVVPPTFPISYDIDAGLWQPDQNAMGGPMACTGFTQADLCADEDKIIYDPFDIYRNTPPYDEGGRDIRAALKTITTRGVRPYLSTEQPSNKRTAYFAIRALPPLDFYDATRLAMLSTKAEYRAVSMGIPWFPEFQKPLPDATLFAPNDYNTSRATWHNVKIVGWDVRGLKVKSWQGDKYGEAGWVYMPRALTNMLMSISGTAAFTVSKIAPGQVTTIDMSFVQWIIAFIKFKLGL